MLKVINGLVAIALLSLVSAAPPPRGGSDAMDVTQHPEILATDYNPAMISIRGIHLGDPMTKVTADMIDRSSSTGGLTKLVGGYAVRWDNDTRTVTALNIYNRLMLAKAGFNDKFDVEFKLGVPEFHDDRHFAYLKKRLLVQLNNTDIIDFEIR